MIFFESSLNLSHLIQVQVEEKRMILSPEMTLLGGRNMHFLPVTFSLVGERLPIIIIIVLLLLIYH